jgi:hypothetical protein
VLFHESLKGPCATLRLGSVVGTKAGREQTATIFLSESREAFELLSMLVSATAPAGLLFPFSYSFYNRRIKEMNRRLNIGLDYSGHSPRAGFASERIANGEPKPEVQARGRWLTASSFNVYCDVTLAAQVEADFKFKDLQAAAEHCLQHLDDYFSAEGLAQHGGSHSFSSAQKALQHTRGSERAGRNGTGEGAEAPRAGSFALHEGQPFASPVKYRHSAAQQGGAQSAEGRTTPLGAAPGRRTASAAAKVPAAKSAIKPPYRKAV